MVNLEYIVNKLFFLLIGVYGFLFLSAFLLDSGMPQSGAAGAARESSGDSTLAGE